MPYLAAAVVLVGLLCLLDLLLTVGVIRRLREHGQLIARDGGIAGTAAPFKDMTLPVGAAPPPFSATTTDGQVISLENRKAPTAIAFFMPGCEACAEELPKYLAYAAEMPGGRGQTWAIIAADESQSEEAEHEATRLADAILVVRDPHPSPLAGTFAVRAFPAFCVLDEAGVVLASAGRVADLPAPAELAADDRPADGRPADDRPADGRPADGRPLTNAR